MFHTFTFKGEWKPKIIVSLYESDLIIETCEPTVLCYKAVKKIKTIFPEIRFRIMAYKFSRFESDKSVK